MSPGFRPRWMDCDEPGWNPDSRRDSTAEPEQASDRMALALPSECIVYPIRYTMHVNAEGSERDRKSASLLDGKTESDTPLVLTTMTEESSTFILVSFDDDSYLIIDERSSGVLQIEHASDDAYARIVLGAYEEGATHQLWRFEPTGHGSYYLVSKRNGLVVDLCNFQLADGSPLIAYPRNNGWNQQFHFDCAGTLDTDLSTLPEEADDSGESELLCADDGSSKPLSFFDLFKTIEPTFSLDQMTDTESWGSYLSAPEAEYHPFAGDEATLLLMSKKSERINVRCKHTKPLIPEYMKERTINYLVLTNFLPEGVEPARFVNDRPIPAKGEHPAPDPYLYTLSSCFDMISISQLTEESLRKLPDGTALNKVPAFEGYFLTYDQKTTSLDQEEVMHGIFNDLEIWGRDHKTKTPLNIDLVIFLSNTNDGGSSAQFIDMNEIRIPKPGELQEGFDHRRCMAIRLNLGMLNKKDGFQRDVVPVRNNPFRFDPLYGFVTSWRRKGFRHFSHADYITKRKLVRAWAYLVKLEEIVGNQTLAPVFFHEFSHAIEFTLNSEGSSLGGAIFNPDDSGIKLSSLGINHQQFAMRIVLNGAYENMHISHSKMLSHLGVDYDYLHERLDRFWRSWGKTF